MLWKCPRSLGRGLEGAHTWHKEKNTCSYCGSLNPEAFMEKIKAGARLTPTDKNYKVYLDDTMEKFYFQHLDGPQKEEFIRMVNAKEILFNKEGSSFYVSPYFITYKPA